MKLHQFFKVTAVGLATVGQLIPASIVRAETPAPTKSPAKPAAAVLDLELSANGSVSGEVFNAQKVPLKDVAVSVRQGRNEVAATRSDDSGRFTVKGLKPGVYHVVAGTGQGIYRVWSTRTAPPKSLSQIKIVSDRTVIRAQGPDELQQGGDGRILYDQNGTAYGQVRVVDQGGLMPVGTGAPVGVAGGGSFLSSLGVFDVLTVGVGVAAITVGAIAIDKANNAEKKADAAANTP